VGRVRRARSRARSGLVIAQRPRAGTRQPAGRRVNLTVSRGRR
jgi:beta-lactam-binding protein with PASTA domain